MKHHGPAGEARRERWCSRGLFGVGGSAAVELAFAAPLLATLAIGIADYGALVGNSEALAAATRIGAEYAMAGPTCQGAIGPSGINSGCTADIKNAMQNSANFNPALTFPASFLPPICECDDKTSIACGTLCATVGRPAPNRVFITISASLSVSSLFPWPGFPPMLNRQTEVRVQ